MHLAIPHHLLLAGLSASVFTDQKQGPKSQRDPVTMWISLIMRSDCNSCDLNPHCIPRSFLCMYLLISTNVINIGQGKSFNNCEPLLQRKCYGFNCWNLRTTCPHDEDQCCKDSSQAKFSSLFWSKDIMFSKEKSMILKLRGGRTHSEPGFLPETMS